MSAEAKTPETEANLLRSPEAKLGADHCVDEHFARRLERERDEARNSFNKAVQNAGKCGACAEIIACGSTMHQHNDCPITERDDARRERDALRAELQEWKDRVEALANELNGGAS